MTLLSPSRCPCPNRLTQGHQPDCRHYGEPSVREVANADTKECPECDGTGEIVHRETGGHMCYACGGSGRVRKNKRTFADHDFTAQGRNGLYCAGCGVECGEEDSDACPGPRPLTPSQAVSRDLQPAQWLSDNLAIHMGKVYVGAVCDMCHGDGVQFEKKQAVACEHCRGTGQLWKTHELYTGRKRVQAMRDDAPVKLLNGEVVTYAEFRKQEVPLEKWPPRGEK